MLRNELKLYSKYLYIPSIKPGSFHYTWLRDNCQCDKCFHPTTRQKLHSSGSINPLIKPISAQMTSKSLKITWEDDEHKSEFKLGWLQRFNYNIPFTPLISPIVWNAKEYSSLKETIDYADFQTPSGFSKVLKQIRDYGLAFLKNVPTQDHLIVEDVAKKFGVIKNSFYGSSWDVKNDPSSKNIAYTSLSLGLHMDLCYFEAPPGLQLLHCLENNVSGGTSIFHDIFNTVDRLRSLHPGAFDALTRIPVTFHYDNDGKYYEYHRPTINLDVNDKYQVFYSPPFQGPIRAVRPEDIELFYEAFSIFESLLTDNDYQYQYLMKPGDLALFANRRVLHGRTSFNHSSGTSRWLKGTYVGWDEVKDRIRMTMMGGIS